MIFNKIELTSNQLEILKRLSNGDSCKIFNVKGSDGRSYNLRELSTSGSLYDTLTVRSLIKKGLIKERFVKGDNLTIIGYCQLTLRARVHLLLN